MQDTNAWQHRVEFYWMAQLLILILLLICPRSARSAEAESIKIGLLRNVQNGPIFIAQEKGYFGAEGLAPDLVFFSAAQPIPDAVASRKIVFAAAGTTASLYSLAGRGALRIIAGAAREAPGFHLYGLAASKRAYAGGLKSYRNLPGHVVAIATVGAPAHYSLALIANHYGFDLNTIRLRPLQSYANMVTAVSSGEADAGVILTIEMGSALEDGALKLIGWIGDEIPWQVSVVFTSRAIADGQTDLVNRFLRAYRQGTRDYHEAFARGDVRSDGPRAPQLLAILSKYIERPVKQIRSDIAYIDAEGRLDVGDIRRQFDWYRSQGLANGAANEDAGIDDRYVIPLPEH